MGVRLLFSGLTVARYFVVPSLHHILKCSPCRFRTLFYHALYRLNFRARHGNDFPLMREMDMVVLELMEFGSGSGRDFRKCQEASFSAQGFNLTLCVGIFVSNFF